MRRQDEEWAIFWCSLLQPVLFGEVQPADTNRFLKTLAEQEHLFPNGVRKKPSLSTLRRKLRQIRRAGFDGLARRRRADRGRSRAHAQEIIDKAIELKRDQPRRSDEAINQFLKAWYGKTLPKSTLYRFLKQAGATRVKLGVTRKPVRRRWTRDRTHDLWLGDFEEGPYVLHQGQAVASLSRNRYQPVYVYLTHVSANGLLKLIVAALGEAPKHSKDRLFLQILDKTRQIEPTTLLVLDEAHLVAPEALTDLRLLVSSVLEDGPSLKIVLTGQEALRDQLKHSCHADLVHRISVRYHVPPMTQAQTAAYMDHHMTTAGASDKVFDTEAKGLIHDYASGLPRQINNIATACLIQAAARNVQKINEQLVNDTMAEFQLP